MSGTIFLGLDELSVSETQPQVLVPIERTGDLSRPVTIEYGITGNEATAGQDFDAVASGTVTMAAGVARILIPVSIRDDLLSEATETLVVSLANVDSGFLQAPRTARIAILDNENPVTDPPEPPLVSPYTVREVPVVAAGLNAPIDLEFQPGSANLAYVAEKGGRIKVIDTANGSVLSTFVDIAAKVNDIQDRGLLDIALDPNFPARPYIYAFYVVDPAGTVGQTGNAGPNGGGNRYAHVVRFTADAATGYRTAVPGSETIILGGAGRTLADISGAGAVDSTSNLAQSESGRIAATGAYVDNYIKVDSRSHAGGSLAFGSDGALYVSIGDGTSFNFSDPRSVSVQNLDSLSGKILRIDPDTGRGLADNPFVTAGLSLSSNRARVYQMGFRNPFSISFDSNGGLVVTDTGWNSFEEINTGGAGANFGWPFYEGADNGVLRQTPGYRDFASAPAFYQAVASGTVDVSAAYRAFSHLSADPGFQVQAITGGDVAYTGNRYPAAFRNDYFFTDVSQGEVFSIDLDDRRDVTYLYKTPNNFGPVRFTQGPDGYVYYVDLIRNQIGRLDITGGPAVNQPPVATADTAATGTLTVAPNLNVLANDSDPDGPAAQLVVSAVNGQPARVGTPVAGTSGGIFTVSANGTAGFDPNGNFADLSPGTSRTTSVTYAAADASGAEAAATYSVTVTAPQNTGSTIAIAARGETGNEIMHLQIDGELVAVFENVAVGTSTYSYRATGTVLPSDVRVAFVNDVWDPANGIDNNLIVDNIRIDGRTFETEDPSVYSTGSWRPEDGIVPGFGRGETLAGEGYFQYAEPASPGSTVAIFARGERGEETMQLFIQGALAQTWTNVAAAGDVYIYNSASALTANDLRIAFTNDLWEPAIGIDRNLVIDKIVLDGATFQTEAPSVFSTGSWLPADGIAPGFGRGDTLAANGYFQYAAVA